MTGQERGLKPLRSRLEYLSNAIESVATYFASLSESLQICLFLAIAKAFLAISQMISIYLGAPN